MYVFICLSLHNIYIYTDAYVCVKVYIHYFTLHHITLHYITLHYFTLHHITIHDITLHYIT